MSPDCPIVQFMHCADCIKEMPHGIAPKDWARLSVGWTFEGIAVWCARHDKKVIHLDFVGQKVQPI